MTVLSDAGDLPLETSASNWSASWDDVKKTNALLHRDALTLAYATIEQSGIADEVLELTRKQRGRKPYGLTAVDVLAACIALALQGGVLQFRAMAELLHGVMPERERLARQITRPWPTPTTPNEERSRMVRAAEEAVRRRFESLVHALDSYGGPRNHRMTLGDLVSVTQEHLAKDPGAELAAAKRQNLVSLMNRLVQGTLNMLPEDLIAQVGPGFAIDGTFTPTWASAPKGHKPYGKTLEALTDLATSSTNDATAQQAVLKRIDGEAQSRVAADPEAGHYIRTNNDGSTEYKGFGYEAHLAVITDADGQRGNTSFPSLVAGLSIDTPGVKPGPNAIEIATSVQKWSTARGIKFKIAIFDALYPSQAVPTFHRPLRLLGLRPIYRLKRGQLGKSGTSHEGLIAVEGAWYCEQMPARLVDASKDREDGKISEAQYQKRLQERGPWAVYSITGDDALNADGTPKSHRVECPASNRNNPVSCVRNEAATPKSASGLPLIPLPVKPLPLGADGKPVPAPAACAQRTVMIPWDVTVGVEQAAPYKSPEWHRINDRYRSTNEGKNGRLKDPAQEAIGTKGVRRVNGLAANGILLACQVAASNLRATSNFLRAAREDSDGRLRRTYTSRGQRSVSSAGPSRPGPARATRRPGASSARAASARARA